MSLGTLYRDALRVALGDGKNCVCYDYSSDFAELWRRCDGSDEPALLSQCLVPQPSDECQTDIGVDEHSRHKRIIIVWDGQPPAPAGSDASDDPVHKQLEHHLTPLDWALAFSIRVLKDSEMSGQACFCINIIDLTAKQYEHAWAMRMRYQLLADMPWVRMFAPQVSGRTAPFQTHSPVLVPDSTNALLVHDSEWMVNVNECAKPIAGSVTSGHRERLMDMARQWSASLTQSNDHHDVNNIIGPVVLNEMLSNASPPCSSVEAEAKAVEQANADALTAEQASKEAEVAEQSRIFVSAFLGKLKWMCFLDLPFQYRLEISESGLRLDEIGIERLRVLVVDDELSRGWDSILCRFFSTNRGSVSLSQDNFARLDCNTVSQDGHSPVEVYGCTSSLPLTRHLSKKQFVERDFSFSFFSGNNDESISEILVVDLRLFGTVNSSRFRDHIESLVKIIEEYGLTEPENLAWQPIAVSEVDQIKAWLNPKPHQEPVSEVEQIKTWPNYTGNFQGLNIESSLITLLPRILALASPLTPIMLFSSTGRADIKEKFRPYRNILTGFSKPQVLQDFADIEEMVTQFLTSRHRALHMLAFRQRLARCIASAKKVDGYRCQVAPTKSAHVDIFFDESLDEKKSKFVLGSAAAMFTDKKNADMLQHKLESEAEFPAINGTMLPVWAKADVNRGDVLPKFNKIQQTLGDHAKKLQLGQCVGRINAAIVDSQAKTVATKWASLGVFRDSVLPAQLNNHQKTVWVDQYLDLMLRFSVQFNIFILPRLLNIEKVSCSLYFDRRSVPPTNIDYGDPVAWDANKHASEKQKAKELQKKFGVEITGKPLSSNELLTNPRGKEPILIVTYPISSYYPLVREAIMNWSPEWAKRVTFEDVRGQQISTRSYNLNSQEDEGKFRIRRWLHDIVDWVSGAERTNWGASGCLKNIFPHQYRVNLNSDIEACMRAAQNASWGRVDECIGALLQDGNIFTGKGVLCDIEEILVWACSDTIKLANGANLHSIFESQYVSVQRADIWGARLVVRTQIADTPLQSSEPMVGMDTPATATSELLTNPWGAIASFVEPRGFELLQAAQIENIQGVTYWVLANKNGTEVAMSPVDIPILDAQSRIGQIGLWNTQPLGLVERPNLGGYSVFAIERWFDGQSNFCGSIPSSSIETLPESGTPRAGIADLGQTCNVESPVVLEVAENQAPLEIGSLNTSAGFQTWEELIGDRVDVIKAKVFSIDTKAIKFRSENQDDRQPYSSDCFLTLGMLTRGDRVIIRPKQEEGQYLKVAGYVESDVIAYYSESAGLWYLLTLIE